MQDILSLIKTYSEIWDPWQVEITVRPEPGGEALRTRRCASWARYVLACALSQSPEYDFFAADLDLEGVDPWDRRDKIDRNIVTRISAEWPRDIPEDLLLLIPLAREYPRWTVQDPTLDFMREGTDHDEDELARLVSDGLIEIRRAEYRITDLAIDKFRALTVQRLESLARALLAVCYG